MFTITDEEKQMLVDEAYYLLNSQEVRIMFKWILENFDDLKEACIKAGYNINASHTEDRICREVMQIILKG